VWRGVLGWWLGGTFGVGGLVGGCGVGWGLGGGFLVGGGVRFFWAGGVFGL